MDILTGAIGGAIYAILGAGKSVKAGEEFRLDHALVTVVAGAVLGGMGQLFGISPDELGGMQFSVVLNMGVLYAFNKLKDVLGAKNVLVSEKQ